MYGRPKKLKRRGSAVHTVGILKNHKASPAPPGYSFLTIIPFLQSALSDNQEKELNFSSRYVKMFLHPMCAIMDVNYRWKG